MEPAETAMAGGPWIPPGLARFRHCSLAPMKKIGEVADNRRAHSRETE